jgi:hypothetical protein
VWIASTVNMVPLAALLGAKTVVLSSMILLLMVGDEVGEDVGRMVGASDGDFIGDLVGDKVLGDAVGLSGVDGDFVGE